MPINNISLRRILPSHKLSQLVEDTNWNFDQMLLYGGGPKGDKGDRGDRGIAGRSGIRGLKGDTGDRGSRILFSSFNISNGDPVTNPDHLEGDVVIDSDGEYYVVVNDGFGNLTYVYSFSINTASLNIFITDGDTFDLSGVNPVNKWVLREELPLERKKDLFFVRRIPDVSNDISEFYRIVIGADNYPNTQNVAFTVTNIIPDDTPPTTLASNSFFSQIGLKYRSATNSNVSANTAYIAYREDNSGPPNSVLSLENVGQSVEIFNHGSAPSSLSYIRASTPEFIMIQDKLVPLSAKLSIRPDTANGIVKIIPDANSNINFQMSAGKKVSFMMALSVSTQNLPFDYPPTSPKPAAIISSETGYSVYLSGYDDLQMNAFQGNILFSTEQVSKGVKFLTKNIQLGTNNPALTGDVLMVVASSRNLVLLSGTGKNLTFQSGGALDTVSFSNMRHESTGGDVLVKTSGASKKISLVTPQQSIVIQDGGAYHSMRTLSDVFSNRSLFSLGDPIAVNGTGTNGNVYDTTIWAGKTVLRTSRPYSSVIYLETAPPSGIINGITFTNLDSTFFTGVGKSLVIRISNVSGSDIMIDFNIGGILPANVMNFKELKYSPSQTYIRDKETIEIQYTKYGVGTYFEGQFQIISRSTSNYDVMIGMVNWWWGLVWAIPSGWEYCDGAIVTNPVSPMFGLNKPDLRGKSIAGYDAGNPDYNTLLAGGGANTQSITLAIANLPHHVHTGTTNTTGDHTHTVAANAPTDTGGDKLVGGDSGSPDGSETTSLNGSHSHTVTTTTTTGALATPIVVDVRSPYITLIPLIRTY